MDITHDPAHGVDAGKLAEKLRIERDGRIKYVISNRRIFSSKVMPWTWRPYSGANAHTQHVHISVMASPQLYDATIPWELGTPGTNQRRMLDIVATVFGGPGDEQASAYGGKVNPKSFGCALPYRFKGTELKPQVRAFNRKSGQSVICDIVDVGPWNITDPYWRSKEGRPQAETGKDMKGRKTNLAGIDLTPAAASAIGIKGKGKVDWEFI